MRTEAPEFKYPQLSTDPNNPTTVAAGPFPFRYEKRDHNYIWMRIYELRSGVWVAVKTLVGGSQGTLGNGTNLTFKDNTNYKMKSRQTP